MVDTTSPYLAQPKKGKNKTGIIIGIVILIIVIVGGIFMFRQSKSTPKEEATITTTIEPSPTVTPKIDKSTVKIQVQNGTGTPGQASTAVDAIVKAGYNQDNIKTSNAKDFSTTVTTITAKTGFESVASDIRNALKSTFSDVKIDSSQLDSTSDFDIVVITGGKKYETATPGPTSSSTTSTPIPTSTTTPSSTPSPTP